jgi:hypothetical protein
MASDLANPGLVGEPLEPLRWPVVDCLHEHVARRRPHGTERGKQSLQRHERSTPLVRALPSPAAASCCTTATSGRPDPRLSRSMGRHRRNHHRAQLSRRIPRTTAQMQCPRSLGWTLSRVANEMKELENQGRDPDPGSVVTRPPISMPDRRRKDAPASRRLAADKAIRCGETLIVTLAGISAIRGSRAVSGWPRCPFVFEVRESLARGRLGRRLLPMRAAPVAAPTLVGGALERE